jgi:ABC-type sugar transport system ATPase subunit
MRTNDQKRPHAIEFRGLVKRFGKMVALNHIDFVAEAGQFVALLGPSGCGKTTLLRCLAGFEVPDAGEIIVNGQPVFDATRGIFVPPGQRNLGMVFQSYALWPHMRVNDNVGFGLELQGVPAAQRQQRIEQVLKDVGLGGLGQRYPSELSGGQQQRVALARLLATRPPLFLMDEPLSNLDARLRMDMRAELKRLHHDAGVATVYVTHDQGEAMTMADVIVVMKAGRIQQASPPRELYRQPAHVSVAEFVGMPRMNLLQGEVRHEADGTRLAWAGLDLPLHWAAPRGSVTVAARPEDLQISALLAERGRAPSLAADSATFEVRGVFPSGPETLVQLQGADAPIYVRADHRSEWALGQRVALSVDARNLNLFDTQSGALLRAPPA